MQGCGGLRKLRWFDTRRGKGKRGGLRVCYLHLPEVSKVYMMDIYEAEDLSPAQRKLLAKVAHLIREEERTRKGRKS